MDGDFLDDSINSATSSKSSPTVLIRSQDSSEIERRLHDLTLDFGVVTTATLSRPLQLKELGSWKLNLWLPAGLCRNEREALQALKAKQLPLILPLRELPVLELFEADETRLACGSFAEARTALTDGNLATLLPDFLQPAEATRFQSVRIPGVSSTKFFYRLAWNPRLLRLNPHAGRRRDFLIESLVKQMRV